MELVPAWLEIGIVLALALTLIWYSRSSTFRLMAVRWSIVTFGIALLFTAGFLTLMNTGERNSQIDYSPDGSHFARVMVGLPWLYPTETAVILRSTHSWGWTRVYRGPGWMAGGGEASPYLEWTDNVHLVIHYHVSGQQPRCLASVGGITVECRAHDW